MPDFESFINDYAIPKNWEVLSARFDTSKLTVNFQRRKIIGEILEYAESVEKLKAENTELAYQEMCLELADIALSICTLLHIQGRRFVQNKYPFDADPESMIMKIICRASSEILSGLHEYALLTSIDLISHMKAKIYFNTKRKDWDNA